MNKNVYILIITLHLVFCQCIVYSAEIPEDKTASWTVGVASVVITPEQSMWMAGYANRTHPSEGVLHDLKAKAIVFEDAKGNQSVLITTDLLGFPKALSENIRNNLKSKFGFSRSRIILNSSHTHSGPVLRGSLLDIYPIDSSDLAKINQYSDWLQKQIVLLVGKALNSMQPVKLYAENGFARFQVNRRNNNEKTLWKQTELNGPNDYSVPVLKVVNNKNELVSVIFGYGCHPTVLNGYDWSGDYPGFAQIELEKFYPGATAFFFQGSGADQNPLPRRTIPLAVQYGKDLAIAVERVLAGEMNELLPTLECAYSEVELPLINQPTIEELLKMEKSSSDYQKKWATRLISKIKNGEELQKSYPYPVQVWSLGELPIISLGGELVSEYSLELRRILGNHIFIMGYSNDVMAYIPSSTILMEGGYEAATSQIVYGLPGVWAPSIEVQILHEILQLAETVKIPLYSEINLSKD